MKIYGAKAFRKELVGIIRNNRPEWLVEEIGEKYERVTLDPQAGETKSPSYLKINPFGRVPALQDGDFTMFESAATCQYIAEKYKKFIPLAGSPEYYTCIQWCYFAVTNIEPNALMIFRADVFMEQGEQSAFTRKVGIDRMALFLPQLENLFSNQESLLKSGFSIADILLTTSLLYTPTDEILAAYPNIRVYLRKMSERPAYKRAIAVNGV